MSIVELFIRRSCLSRVYPFCARINYFRAIYEWQKTPSSVIAFLCKNREFDRTTAIFLALDGKLFRFVALLWSFNRETVFLWYNHIIRCRRDTYIVGITLRGLLLALLYLLCIILYVCRGKTVSFIFSESYIFNRFPRQIYTDPSCWDVSQSLYTLRSECEFFMLSTLISLYY